MIDDSHIELGRQESIAANTESDWEKWVDGVEGLLGQELDGELLDGNLDEDGFSLDDAYERFKRGWSPEYYHIRIIERRAAAGRGRVAAKEAEPTGSKINTGKKGVATITIKVPITGRIPAEDEVAQALHHSVQPINDYGFQDHYDFAGCTMKVVVS